MDIVSVYPLEARNRTLARNLEIRRVLSSRLVGVRSPDSGTAASRQFEAQELPAEWRIVGWIAIDDVDLTAVATDALDKIVYMSYFMSSPEDNIVGNGWMRPPVDFKEDVLEWMFLFVSHHFVE